MRETGIDVYAVKARAAKSASFDFLEPAELNLPKEPQAYAAALKAHIEKSLKQGEDQARAYLKEQGLDADALRARALANPTPEPDAAAIVAAMVGNLPIPESQRQAYVKEVAAFQKKMGGLEADQIGRFEQATQEAASTAATGDAYGGPTAHLGDLPAGPPDRLPSASGKTTS